MHRFPFLALLVLISLSSISCYDWAYNPYLYKQAADDQADTTTTTTTTVQDTVYLNDGSVIHGKIIEETPGSSIKIQTSSGNVFTYRMDAVTKITHAQVPTDN